MMQRLGIGIEEQQIYASMEAHFQEYIRNHTTPIRDMLSQTGYRVIPMSEVEARFGKNGLPGITVSCMGENGKRLKPQPETRICPMGMESARIFLTSPQETVKMTITIGAGSCLVRIRSHLAGREKRTVEGLTANGMDLGGGLYLFLAETAELTLDCTGNSEVEINLQIQVLSASINQALIEQVSCLHEQRTALESELILLKGSKYYKAYEKTKRLLKR